MKILEKIKDTSDHLQEIRNGNISIGFIPTMGALHQGHLSLIKEAKKENGYVTCSIFVNPIQFNNKNDLQVYPRDINRDIKLLESAGCDFLFHPSETEMYPEPVNVVFDFGNLDKVMEGMFRPGHFNGVAVVVKKLFEILKPDRAYFGLKDYQQLVIIHKVVNDFKLPVEIVPCSTVREEDGLAMSSRNQLLSKTDRLQAAMIYEALKMVKIQSGYSTINEIKYFIEQLFRKTKNTKLEYFEIVDMFTLKPLTTWAQSSNVIACIAVYVGNVRLIDNIILFS
jgi:pantoate--beta-alanine ligase